MSEDEYGRCLECKRTWAVSTLKTDKRKGLCSCGYHTFRSTYPNRIVRAWLRLIGR